MVYDYFLTSKNSLKKAWLAQSVERTTLNRVVVGSIPTLGESYDVRSFYFESIFLLISNDFLS